MKDHALELSAREKTSNGKLNILREYAQTLILRILQEQGFFRSTAFVGGTALRFVYGLPRFSEDLDFSIEGKEKRNFVELARAVKRGLELQGYTISLTYKDTNAVKYAFVKFEGLLHEAALTPHAGQKLSVKIEVDSQAPAGAALETRIVNKHVPLAFLTYDVPSLFAGKIHALLSRRYTKGRDFFDLGWYLSTWKNLTPNFQLLQNALKQTGWKGPLPTEKNWRSLLLEVVQAADWKKVRSDVQNFLERPSDLEVFTKENVLRLLGES